MGKISKFNQKHNIEEIKTEHTFYMGNAVSVLRKLQENPIQLIISSPPYWKAKDYKHPGQLGYKDTYSLYLQRVKEVFVECERILLPDGKIAINVGNIYDFDATDKRHYTVNIINDIWKLLSSIKDLRFMGTICWKKPTSRSGAVLFGSYPYPSNFMISTALEAIFVFRKIGKRKVLVKVKEKSKITKEEFRKFREPIWILNGTGTKDHPAVFPNEIPRGLIKMYSFYGDAILDPFCGIGTTNSEALKLYRNSIGIDVKPAYIKLAARRMKNRSHNAKVFIVKEKR